MTGTPPAADGMVGTAVVALPAEIDTTNADRVAAELQAAFAPGVTAVVGDMTATTFCDSRGIRALVLAHRHATARGAELRLVVRSAPVLRVMGVLGVDELLRVYSSLQQALAAEPRPRA